MKKFFNMIKSVVNSNSKESSTDKASEYQESFKLDSQDDFNIEEYNETNKEIISVFKNKYDLTTINGIENIDVPKNKSIKAPYSAVSTPEAILKKQATLYKRDGNFELAIACLRKANEFMLVSFYSYKKDDYLRLVEYLKKDKQFDESRKEQIKIDDIFGDSQLSKDVVEKIKQNSRSEYTDLVQLSNDRGVCGECAKYRGRVFSLSGNDDRYPKYSIYYDNKSCECRLCEFPFIDSVSTLFDNNSNVVDAIEYSNRPFIDDRTDEEKENYNFRVDKKRQEKINRSNYDYLREFMPDIAPKSYGGYVKMRNLGSETYKKIYDLAFKQGVDLNEEYK